MTAMARTATVDVQPIDRLEEKVKLLVGLVDTLRADKARAEDETSRLQQEVNALRGRLNDAAGVSSEVAALREERDMIKTRVTQMISAIDKLDL
jgi:regulator of replication initiation timing